jgi:hypothetical protein
MSRRITLSVPDALHDQIECWRESFNLSRVFQEAVADMIRRREELQERLKEDLPQVIARLKREKLEAEENWFEKGLSTGLQWARNAHFLELTRVVPQKAESLAAPGGELQDYFRAIFKGEERAAALQEGFEEFRRSFLAGWQKGVNDFWSLVRDKL